MAVIDSPVVLALKYIRDLLDFDEGLMGQAKTNESQDTSNADRIIVDLLVAKTYGRTKKYDVSTETQTVTLLKDATITIDFYGDNALDNAQTFEALLDSEEGTVKQKTYGVTIYNPTDTTNVMQLQGKQYNNRYQITAQMRYNVVKPRSVNKITTGNTNFIYNY
jgi:hypothetical protein